MIRSFCTRILNMPKIVPSGSCQMMAVRNMCDSMDDGNRFYEKGVNQVTLMGRIGTDPQLRGNETHPVVIISLATHSHYKSNESEGMRQKTDWHRISVFKPRLQQRMLEYAKKGSRMYVQGKLSYGEFTDSNGVTHQTTNIIADDVIFLNSNQGVNELEDNENQAVRE